MIVPIGDPADASRTGLHKLAPQNEDGLLAKIGRVPERASASGCDVRVVLVYGARP